jgi:hypothetical protein
VRSIFVRSCVPIQVLSCASVSTVVGVSPDTSYFAPV